MSTAELIRLRRKEKGLTQMALGKLLGYSGRTAELMVQHWETGRREIPANKYRLISEILEIPLEDLVP